MAPQNTILDGSGVARALEQLAQGIAADRAMECPFCLIGIRTRGVPLANRLAALLELTTGSEIPVGAVDITLYRDDLTQISHNPVLRGTEIDFSLDDKPVVLVDDVIFTGRTVRAALGALCDLGRPAAVRLAVLVDRGHRELPIQPDYCALRVSTELTEHIEVRLQEVDGTDEVRREPGPFQDQVRRFR